MANTDYGAIPLTLATATSQALNHRLGVSTGFKPSEWAENINLLVKPAEKSASGSVAHFTDGLDMPLVNGKFGITAYQDGTGTPSPSNVRAIHGYTAMNIVRTGKNLLPNKTYQRTAKNLRLGTDSIDGRLSLNKGTYTLSVKTSKSGDFSYIISGTSTAITTTASGEYRVGTFTLSQNSDDIFLQIFFNDGITASDVSDIQLELGSSATAYSPYNGTSLNIPFGQTVYGGSLNVVTGELTIEYAIFTVDHFDAQGTASARLPVRIVTPLPRYKTTVTADLADLVCDKALVNTSSEGTGTYDNTITCRMASGDNDRIWFFLPLDVASDLAEANTWASTNKPQVVYPLATPTTITLTPHQMSSLLGENNIWADCGDSAVVYRGMVGDSFKCFFNSQVTSGWTGTSVERTMLTVTGNGNGSITFDNNGKGRTNCSNSDGYISVRKNGTAVYTKSLAPNTDETLAIPAVNFSAGDVITLVFGFANYHSNINMKLTGDSFTVQGSATVSGISNTTNTSTTLEVST